MVVTPVTQLERRPTAQDVTEFASKDRTKHSFIHDITLKRIAVKCSAVYGKMTLRSLYE
jgi:hypothetical protein